MFANNWLNELNFKLISRAWIKEEAIPEYANPDELKRKLRDLLSNDKVETVIDILFQLKNKHNHDMQDITIEKAEFKLNERSHRNGLISYEVYGRVRNKIVADVQQMIDAL